MPDSYSTYNCFASIYNHRWGAFAGKALPVLETLLLAELRPGARILDLCCGTGQLAGLLGERGFMVVGVDGSEEMLRHARENAPMADFVRADARDFALPIPCDAAISIYDSLNHLMSIEELTAAFGNVYAALQPGGVFVFDLNMEEAFRANWADLRSLGIVEDTQACIARSSYDADNGIGHYFLTIFRLIDGWQRDDIEITEKCYSADEIRAALESVGFDDVQAFDLERDLGFKGTGRCFFRCRRPSP